MGSIVELEASDGHRLDAYRAEPAGKARGRLIVVQEAFGVNEHIRAVCDDYSGNGYVAMAPAIYDRQQRNATFGYDEASVTHARDLLATIAFSGERLPRT